MKQMIIAALVALLVVGCGRDDSDRDVYSSEYMASTGTKYGWTTVDVSITYNKADWRFKRWLTAKNSDYLRRTAENFLGNGLSAAVVDRSSTNWQSYGDYQESAYAKRKVALLMARCGYTYTFKNYIVFDGVSGLIYNTAYLFSIPRKLLSGMLALVGVKEYLWNSTKLLIGGVFAVIGIPCAFIVNTLCHPFETLANLTIGVAYFGQGWFHYVLNTNLVASLWDLLWGAIFYPLLQAVFFFM